MENISQLMDVNIVDIGDESSVSPILRICGSETIRGSTPLPTVSLANANLESDAYKKKQRTKTSKVSNNFKSVVVGGIKKSQCM
jgi:hypothetical protein